MAVCRCLCRERQWHLLLAASLVAVVPVFEGLPPIQRRLVAGLAAGGGK